MNLRLIILLAIFAAQVRAQAPDRIAAPAAFLDEKHRSAPDDTDIHFERFLASCHLLEPDAAAPEASPLLCSPFMPLTVTRS